MFNILGNVTSSRYVMNSESKEATECSEGNHGLGWPSKYSRFPWLLRRLSKYIRIMWLVWRGWSSSARLRANVKSAQGPTSLGRYLMRSSTSQQGKVDDWVFPSCLSSYLFYGVLESISKSSFRLVINGKLASWRLVLAQ